VLPLSDHADYEELVRTARESGARQIYTVHGPERFAERLCALGLPARHLAAHPQDFCDDDEGEPTVAATKALTPAQGSLDLQ
jgi:Cft2 family RNA processing exonuclease